MVPNFVRVPGTSGTPYLFGAGEHRRPIEIRDFSSMARYDLMHWSQRVRDQQAAAHAA